MNITTFFRCSALASAAALVALCTGCSSASDRASSADADDSVPTIVVGAYPWEFVASRVAGQYGKVTNLLAPGSDSHDLELSPKQVATVASADLVIYQAGFQAAMDDAIDQQAPAHVLNTATFIQLHPKKADPSDDHDDHDGHDHTSTLDPHMWLDPANMAEVADHIAQSLSELRPDKASVYSDNAEALKSDLSTLDQSLSAGLSDCATTTFVPNHAAFGYLAEKYHLNQVAISGLSPEEEPSAARISEIQKIAKENNLTTIFYETAASPKVSQTLASDLGLVTDVLDPVETLSSDSRGSDYIEVMQSNLEALRQANGCK